MLTRIKKLMLLIGLLVCIAMMLITILPTSSTTHGMSIKPTDQKLYQLVVKRGTQWIIQTTYQFIQTK